MIKTTVHYVFTDHFWESEWYDKQTSESQLLNGNDYVVFRDKDDVEVVIPKHIMDDCVVYFEEIVNDSSKSY